MDPLIITSSDPKVPEGPHQVEETIAECIGAANAGAAILHKHLIYQPYVPGTRIDIDVDKSVEVIRQVRKKTNAIFQLGITRASDESRMAVATREHVDMMSLTLGYQDQHNGAYPNVTHDRDEIVRWAKFCLDHGIVPEWEIFHSGCAWNLMYLIKHGYAKPPYWINLTMYPEGSSWSPRTMDEIDNRVKCLPEDSQWHLVCFARAVKDFVIAPVTPAEHNRLLTYAILAGGGIRVGKEERAEVTPGVPAKTNVDLMNVFTDMATKLGRPPATPDQARKILRM